MSRVAFLLDEHVSHIITLALRRRGIDVLTADEAALRGAPDEEHLIRSREQGRVVVTQDADFLRLHQHHAHAGIAYCAQGSRSITQMIGSLLLIAEVLESDDMIGKVEFL